MLKILAIGLMMTLFSGVAAMPAAAEEKPAEEKPAKANRYFEMRIYTAHPGKLAALHKRFADHTNRLFMKHGMELIGFWTPTEGPEVENTLIYILAFPDRKDRDAAFDAFRKDPEWIKARDESHKDGELVLKVESKFLTPTAYSAIK